MKKFFVAYLSVFLLWLPLRAQEVIKGLPADFTAAQLLIVAYEPSQLIPAEAKTYERIYKQQTPPETHCAQVNAELTTVLTAAYPYSYRIVSRQELPGHTSPDSYIFEPGKLYSLASPWASVPLYIRHATSGRIYEIGFMPKNAIYSPEKILTHFIRFLPKLLPVQALDKVADKD